jgi:lysophospholipase L1-like esterase
VTFIDLAGRAMKALAAVAFLFVVAVPASADPSTSPTASRTDRPPCDTALDLVRLDVHLKHVSQRIAAHEPVTIVALGSSSTAGAGASAPDNSYPARLGVELRTLFPGQAFNIINKGVNGEEVTDMLRRFDEAVIANKPDLVVWQLGTNSLIRDHEMTDRGALIRQGLNKVRAARADTILVDPQYAPKVVVKPQAVKMVKFLSAFAKEENIAMFRRFLMMKRWTEIDRLPYSAFVTPDDLHMNDFGYGCMAKGLALAIADSVRRPIVSAKVVAPAK